MQSKRGTPGKVEILVEREEAFVEILSVPVRDRFERRSSVKRGSPAHAKNLIVPVELMVPPARRVAPAVCVYPPLLKLRVPDAPSVVPVLLKAKP